MLVQQDNGQWGAVCSSGPSSGFSNMNAKVVCRQLGLPWTGAVGCGYYCQGVLYQNAGPGTLGSEPFRMASVQCTGSENQLTDCPHFKGMALGLSCSNQDAGEKQSLGCVMLGL